MPYLAAAVVLVGVLCLLDLVLTLGVIRRLKDHTAHLETLLRRGDGTGLLPVGEIVGEFSAATIEGEPVSRERLASETFVGFFAPGCGACDELLPTFVEFARDIPGGRERVLAVMVGDEAAAAPMCEVLAQVARVVVEEPGGEVSRAFEASAFPALCVVDETRTVIATGEDTFRRLAAAEA